MYSLDFQPVAQLEQEERRGELATLLVNTAKRLERAGADLWLVASTLHSVVGDVRSRIGIPFLHIADAAAEEMQRAGITKVGLLGTRFVMEQDFYKERLSAHGLDILIPDTEARNFVHDVIYKELCLARLLETSKTKCCGL